MHFQSALLALAVHASNPVEADRLRYLASPAGKVVNLTWIYRMIDWMLSYFSNVTHLFVWLKFCRMNMPSL